MTEKLAVIAIGGNSLIKSKKKRTIPDQNIALAETSEYIVELIEEGFQIVITHGNGPQVGFIMLRSEIARREVGIHIVPLEIAVADTQGSIGHQIEVAVNNALRARERAPRAVAMVTQVKVDGEDPGFLDPRKPVGEFYTADQLPGLRRQHPDWSLKEDADRGWRRVVASPAPMEILEIDALRVLIEKGFHVIACGGGGIPVVEKEEGLIGVDAVIDKDFTSALLAREIGASLLVISTAVERVALNFGKPDESFISKMTIAEAEQYIREEHFAPGSMLPKIQAALRFLKDGGREVIITAPEFIKEAVVSGKGTHVIP
ncbi:MAG: carbamate kinase [Desulfobacterales bacterium]|nr:carbamate kinase [Desulfobacterales bacterium]